MKKKRNAAAAYRRPSAAAKGGQGALLRPGWYVAACVLLLAPALMAANSAPFPVDRHQLFSWYLTYECGYVSRGLIGGITQLLYGASPPPGEMIKIVEAISPPLRWLTVLLLWALLVAPLWRRQKTSRARWLLLAFAALLLLSPLWKLAAYLNGYMDLWVFLFALAALAALLLKRPLLFAALCVIGSMIHRLMLPYALVLYLLMLHAVFFLPRYASADADGAGNGSNERRRWLLAGGVSFGLIILLQLLAAAGSDSCALLAGNYTNKDAADASNSSQFLANALSPGNASRDSVTRYFEIARSLAGAAQHSLAVWSVFPNAFFAGVVFLLLPPLFVGVSFAALCRAAGLDFPAASKQPAPAARLMRRYGFMLLPVAGALCVAPLHLVVTDTGRAHYWSWLGLSLVCVYYLWHLSDGDARAGGQGAKKPGASTASAAPATIGRRVIVSATAAVFTVALTYAGAPMIWHSVTYPSLIKKECQRFCLFPITVNPLGDWWGNLIYTSLAAGGIPFHATGKQLQKFSYDMYDFAVTGDSITIPPAAAKQNQLLILDFTMPPRSNFTYAVKFDAPEEQPFYMEINDHAIEPKVITSGAMEWSATTNNKYRRLIFKLYARNKKPITLHNVDFQLADG